MRFYMCAYPPPNSLSLTYICMYKYVYDGGEGNKNQIKTKTKDMTQW